MTDKDDAIREEQAIQKDASEEDVSKEVSQDPRQNALDVIVAKREEELAAQVDEEPALDEDKSTKTPEEEPEARDPEKEPEEEVVEVKVHGKISKVPISKILDAGVRTYQKETAADETLAEVKALKAEVEKLREGAAKPADPVRPEEDATDKSDEDLLYAIRYGEQDEALTAIKTLRGRGESVKPDEIDKVVDERLKARDQTSIVGRFSQPVEKGGFQDIYDKPALRRYAEAKVDELVDSGEGAYDDWETYRQAGEWVRKTILGQETKAPDDEVDPVKEKQSLKEKMTTITPASDGGGDNLKTTEPSDPEEDRRATIAEMRKSRTAGRY